MAFSERSLDDYVDVAQRLADFRALYPTGSLQPADPAHPWEQAIVSGYRKDGTEVTQTFIVYTAAAYRTPDDVRPGIGVAWEIWPGRTPYTLGSEIMNAETSAWGRAIVAVLASDSKRGVRSREEMEARDAERLWSAWSGPEPASADCRDGSHCGACTGCRCFCHKGWPVNKDGTLSLSKMSDEQRRDAGVMTRAETREHTALQPKQAEVRGRVTRLPAGPGQPVGAPPIDPWLDQPAGSLPDPEHQPGTITPAQQRAIMKRYENTDRTIRLQQITEIIGHPVTSTNELSYVDAQLVLGKVKAAAK